MPNPSKSEASSDEKAIRILRLRRTGDRHSGRQHVPHQVVQLGGVVFNWKKAGLIAGIGVLIFNIALLLGAVVGAHQRGWDGISEV